MPSWEVRGVANGKNVKGIVDAESEDRARAIGEKKMRVAAVRLVAPAAPPGVRPPPPAPAVVPTAPQVALIPCPACAAPISPSARSCPRCGQPLESPVVPAYYAGPAAPNPNPVQTVQKTAKIWKLLILVGALMMTAGVVMFCIHFQLGAASETSFVVSILLFVVGLFVYLLARFLAWWNHG